MVTRTRYNVRYMYVAYLVCTVRWIILDIPIIQHHPDKFLAVLPI